MGRFINKIVYWVNLVVAILLIISFVLPYLPPKTFPTISLLSLTVPLLIILNIIFALYWAIQLRWKLFLSFTLLFISYFYFNVFYEISAHKNPADYQKTLSILSYNVRLFNAYEKNPKSVGLAVKKIAEILKEQNPDVVCIQEYYNPHKIDFSAYPYKYVHFKTKNVKMGNAIYSKYPLVNTGAFDFKDSYNNTLYADVVKDQDTLRVYSLHLQSIGILPEVRFLQETNKDKLRRRISKAFEKQQNQVDAILKHRQETDYPVLFCGDFNNTPFSYTYRRLKDGMQDAFRERGNGLGTTFMFDRFPMRIDYIFASKNLEILSFETLEKTSSDHYAIKATVSW